MAHVLDHDDITISNPIDDTVITRSEFPGSLPIPMEAASRHGRLDQLVKCEFDVPTNARRKLSDIAKSPGRESKCCH